MIRRNISEASLSHRYALLCLGSLASRTFIQSYFGDSTNDWGTCIRRRRELICINFRHFLLPPPFWSLSVSPRKLSCAARCMRSGRTRENIFVGRAIEYFESMGVFCFCFLCQVYRSDVLDCFATVLYCSKTGNQAEEAFINRAIVLIGTPAVCRSGIRSFILFTR